ncbi:MAG: hypothetical protein RL094_216 [Candidatus Parcubacteria bacterium]|jgi:predicted O-methyltransferase YrrM
MNPSSDQSNKTDILKELRAKSKHVVVTEGLDSYINELLLKSESKEHKEYLNELLALEHSNMQVPLSEARFLESLVKIMNATYVLEIGTFRGFSTTYLARALPSHGKVISCEKDERSISFIKEQWAKLNVDHKIDLRSGMALDTLKSLEKDGPVFDIAFIDGDKGNHEVYLEHCMRLIRKGGVVLVDNVLWAGIVAEEEPGDNIGRNLQKFNEDVFEKYGASACLIPAWDGVTMIVK